MKKKKTQKKTLIREEGFYKEIHEGGEETFESLSKEEDNFWKSKETYDENIPKKIDKKRLKKLKNFFKPYSKTKIKKLFSKKRLKKETERMKKLSNYWAKIKAKMDNKSVDVLEIPLKNAKKKVVIRENGVYIGLILPLKKRVIKIKSIKNGFFSKENINKILQNSYEGSSSEENFNAIFERKSFMPKISRFQKSAFVPLIDEFRRQRLYDEISQIKTTPEMTPEEERRILEFLERNRENLINSEKSILRFEIKEREYFFESKETRAKQFK